MRLGIFVTHPIQYFAPIWRQLAAEPGIDLVVHFFSDHSIRGGIDPGFGVPVAWDVPLLDGYEHRFLSRDADLSRPAEVRIDDVERLLDEGRFDAVMFHGYTHGFERQLHQSAGRRGIRIVMRGEFSDVEPDVGRPWHKRVLRSLFLRRFYRGVDAFGYIGVEAREHLRRHGVAAGRMFFSPYSIDSELFEAQRQRIDRGQARRELAIPEGSIAILFSGKLIPRKEPLLLIEALEKSARREQLCLVCVGDGELRRQVEARGRAALGDRLLMPGFVNQSQMGKYFAASDAFVLPSRFETWGLVVNEAMQFGLPAVVSDRVGCHRDLIVEGQTGYTFRSGDAAALRAAVDRLPAEPAARERMGELARQRVAQYSTRRSVEGILQALASGGAPGATAPVPAAPAVDR